MHKNSDKKLDPENWLLRREDVLHRLQISTSTLNREILAERFPKPIKIGLTSRWRMSWLQEYLDRMESKNEREV